MSLNKCIFEGVITKGSIKYTPGGGNPGDKKSFMLLSIGVQKDRKNQEGKYDMEWVRLVAYGNNADFINNYFKEGSHVIVETRFEMNTYTNSQGQEVQSPQFVINQAHFCGGPANTNQGTNQQAQTGYPAPGQQFAQIPNLPPMPTPQAPIQQQQPQAAPPPQFAPMPNPGYPQPMPQGLPPAPSFPGYPQAGTSPQMPNQGGLPFPQ